MKLRFYFAFSLSNVPLDLSVRPKVVTSSSAVVESYHQRQQPSTSQPQPKGSSAQLLTPPTTPAKGPLRASLKHIKQSQLGNSAANSCAAASGNASGKSVEVKRSASSVVYRAFDPDVSEHFRRSLSGKWPRRQLNYASYYAGKECEPDVDETQYVVPSSSAGPETQQPNKAPATSSSSSSPSSSRFNSLFNRKPFWRKNSNVSTSSGGTISPSPISGKSGGAISTASSPLSVLDERLPHEQEQFRGAMATPPAGGQNEAHDGVAQNSTTQKKKHSSSTSAGGGRNVMTRIIVNEARQVEDHFRMALGEKTFQLLKSAQKSSTPVRAPTTIGNDEVPPFAPTPPANGGTERGERICYTDETVRIPTHPPNGNPAVGDDYSGRSGGGHDGANETRYISRL